MTLYHWHKCDHGCLWWGAGSAGSQSDFCNFENVVEEADTGRPGCHRWVCSRCGHDWDEGIDHDVCMIVEVDLEF